MATQPPDVPISLVEVRREKSDVEETIKEVLSDAKDFTGVIVLGITGDDEPFIRTSTFGHVDKIYLANYLMAYFQSQFGFVFTPDPEPRQQL